MPRPRSKPTSLEQDARRTLGLLSTSLADVLSSLPIPAQRPRDIVAGLKLNQTLAWKVAKIAEGGDLFSASSYVPGQAGLEKFLRAAEQRGASGESLARARVAAAEYERLVQTHTGDRASLESALAALAEGGERPVNVRSLRRESFRAYSQFMGVQQRAHVLTMCLGPSTTPGRADLAFIRGFVGMRALRHGVDFPIARRTAYTDVGAPMPLPEPVLIDPEGVLRLGESVVPVLRACCSSPLPDLQVRHSDTGLTEVLLKPGPLGIHGESTLFMADVHRAGTGLTSAADNKFERLVQSVRAPMELLVVDLFVHRRSYGTPPPLVRELVFSEIEELWHAQLPESATIPAQPERLVTFESAEGAFEHPELGPEYTNAVRMTLDRLGWDATDFRLHRVASEFPLVRSAIGIELTVPSSGLSR